MSAARQEHVEAVRQFGRFYTRQIGVLAEGLLGSPFALAEARLLYEIANHEHTTATELASDLDLDPGYTSRMLERLRQRRFLAKQPSKEDGRVKLLSLTQKGRQAFSKLNAASRDQVHAMLADMPALQQSKLVDAMTTIERILGGAVHEPVPYILRPPQPGDMGWVVHRHGVLYHEEYGWDEKFEALVAGIVAKFSEDFDTKRERCWIAERNGGAVGCVFLARKTQTTAQLRLLLVEPSTRGLGIGKRLVGECTRFAHQVGYRKIVLWTNDVLHAARHIYEREGYRLVQEERHHSFGHDLVGQFWELDLRRRS